MGTVSGSSMFWLCFGVKGGLVDAAQFALRRGRKSQTPVPTSAASINPKAIRKIVACGLIERPTVYTGRAHHPITRRAATGKSPIMSIASPRPFLIRHCSRVCCQRRASINATSRRTIKASPSPSMGEGRDGGGGSRVQKGQWRGRRLRPSTNELPPPPPDPPPSRGRAMLVLLAIAPIGGADLG